ncbi:hypothetical protein AVXHC19_02240 [Acidovorax sacchari]
MQHLRVGLGQGRGGTGRARGQQGRQQRTRWHGQGAAAHRSEQEGHADLALPVAVGNAAIMALLCSKGPLQARARRR